MITTPVNSSYLWRTWFHDQITAVDRSPTADARCDCVLARTVASARLQWLLRFRAVPRIDFPARPSFLWSYWKVRRIQLILFDRGPTSPHLLHI